MTTKEFSDSFDVLFNSYAVSNGFGAADTPYELDEYEKSVLLTQAQNEIVIGLYSGNLNGDSLERTEELRRCLDSLVETDNPVEIATLKGLSNKSQFFKLKDNVWFITYESANLVNAPYCEGSTEIGIIPMKQDEWHKAKTNPFRRPDKRKAVRLDCGNKTVEIISEYPIDKYLVRYLRKPNPIILTDLEGNLKIDDIQEETQCELSTVLHDLILDRAVQLASRRIPSAK